MQLMVSTNWDPVLLEGCEEFPVAGMLGAMAETPLGGGRPAVVLPRKRKTEIAEYLAAVHRKGLEFSYLLNAPCFSNREYSREGHLALLQYLDWLCEIGVDSLTISVPYLIEIVKKQFPGLKVKVSVIAGVDSVQKARFFEELGADEINLDYMCNRNFPLLKEIRKSVSCELTLLANDVCLNQCPFRQYHYNCCGHDSQTGQKDTSFYLDYCVVNCTLQFLTHPGQLIMAPWIRPEDLSLYEACGYNRFKLSGRDMSTPWLKRVIQAYSRRCYHGNLGDLFSSIAVSRQTGKNSFYHIDNNKLDGFLDYFLSAGCSGNCADCAYCAGVAAEAVSYDEENRARLSAFFRELKTNLVQSAYFKGANKKA